MTIGTRDRLRALERALGRCWNGHPPDRAAARRQRRRDSTAANRRRPNLPQRREQIAPPPEPERRSRLAPPATPSPRRCRRRSARRAAEPDRAISFEERFGTRWMVWIGGVALALGGIFLVRLFDRAGPDRTRRAGVPRRAAGGRADRGRRMDAPAASSSRGIAGLPSAHIPSILTAAGTTVAYADVYAAYALYGFLDPASPSCCSAWWRWRRSRAALLHGPALAGARPGRRLCDAAAGRLRPAELLGALHLSRGGDRGRLRARAAAAVALARRHRRRLRVLVDASPASRDQRRRRAAAHALPRRRWALRSPRALIVAGPVLRAAGRAGADRPGLVRRARGLSLGAAAILVLASRPRSAGARRPSPCSSSPPSPSPGAPRRRPARCRSRPCWSRSCSCAGRPTLDIAHLIAPAGPVAGAAPEPQQAQCRLASRAREPAFALLFGGAGFLAQGRSPSGRSCRSCGARRRCSRRSRSWSRSTIASPASSARSRSRRLALLLAALYALRDRDARQARAAAGHRRLRRDLRHRRGRGAGARADLRAGEGLAHRRARADGAGHRLDRRQAAAADAALARRRDRSRWCWRGSAGSRASSAPTSARRRSSTGCSTATACRPPRSGSPAICCAGAPTTRRRAWSTAGAILFTVLLALPRNPPFHERRRHLSRRRRARPRLALQVCVGLAHDDRARALAPAHPAASSTTSARW